MTAKIVIQVDDGIKEWAKQLHADAERLAKKLWVSLRDDYRASMTDVSPDRLEEVAFGAITCAQVEGVPIPPAIDILANTLRYLNDRGLAKFGLCHAGLTELWPVIYGKLQGHEQRTFVRVKGFKIAGNRFPIELAAGVQVFETESTYECWVDGFRGAIFQKLSIEEVIWA